MYASGRPENAIARVASAFKECLSEGEVLKTIDEFFGDLGFEFDPEAEERNLTNGIGQRRSRAAGYLETLDLAEPPGRDRLLSAVATKLAEWADGRGPSADRLDRLHRTLKAAGYEWNGSEVVARATSRQPAPAPVAPVVTPRPARGAPTEPMLDAPSAFISYAHEDKELAQALADALRALGCRIWIDVEKMRTGDDLVERIAEAIDSVDFLLAIVSEESVKSSWCKRELAIAFDAALKTDRVKVLPVRLGSVALPPILAGLYYVRVDPTNTEAMADKLIADMESHRKDRGGGKAAAKRPALLPPTRRIPCRVRRRSRQRLTPTSRSASSVSTDPGSLVRGTTVRGAAGSTWYRSDSTGHRRRAGLGSSHRSGTTHRSSRRCTAQGSPRYRATGSSSMAPPWKRWSGTTQPPCGSSSPR